MVRRHVVALTVFVTLIATVLNPLPIQAAVDQRELRAREAFAIGKYQEALELFAKLYAEKPHPNYLRNIGRCYQNLGETDKAITSFRDYLRNAKGTSPAERQEVEGYIKEMEDLKLKRQGATLPAGSPGDNPAPSGGGSDSVAVVTPLTSQPTPGPGSPASPLVPAGPSPPPGSSGTPDLTLTANPGSAAPVDEAAPVYERWWFWAIVGGVVAAGLGTAAALGAFTRTEDAKCPIGVRC